jgi:aromatic ring-cleaving dioxygenase
MLTVCTLDEAGPFFRQRVGSENNIVPSRMRCRSIGSNKQYAHMYAYHDDIAMNMIKWLISDNIIRTTMIEAPASDSPINYMLLSSTYH